MKKLILIIAVLLGNCVSQPLDVPEFENEIEAFIWVVDELTPVNNDNSGENNCRDKTAIYMSILDNQFNTNYELINISSSDEDRHEAIKVNDRYYDMCLNCIYENVNNMPMIIGYDDIILWYGFDNNYLGSR